MFEPREPVSRRVFLAGAAGLAGLASSAEEKTSGGLGDFLKPFVLHKESIDRFLDPKARVWAKFDPELGYLLRNSFVRDGVDGSSTLARYESTGQRKQVNFPDQVCRINTYGDSFTQGHQVSDGETWQEVLAAHYCEPIRNFGVGGFGVYQAYRRLLRTEATDLGVKFLIFNIWGDDHYRSIYAWRWLSFPSRAIEAMRGLMFHANPWVHARLSERGELIERRNLCADEKSLYKLCDHEFLVSSFKDDEIVHLLAAERTGKVLSKDLVERAASAAGVKMLDLKTPAAVKTTASTVLHTYAVRVGMRVMEKLDTYCRDKGKKLLVLLSYPAGSVWHGCNRTKPGDPNNIDWHPKVFKDFLGEKKISFVDTLPRHVAEFDTFKLSAKAYVDRYYIGHYTPRGNHFFAYAIKDDVLGWLDPKPLAYRTDGEPFIRFKGYLPG
jgi:hypothetical protein